MTEKSSRLKPSVSYIFQRTTKDRRGLVPLLNVRLKWGGDGGMDIFLSVMHVIKLK